MCTGDGDTGVLQEANDTRGRAGREQGIRSARRKMSDVVRMEAVGFEPSEDAKSRVFAHPSTSFCGLTDSVTSRSPSALMWSPRGSCTNIPLTCSSPLSSLTTCTIWSTAASAGS